ncbi:MAG: TetR/AcrR family transcriptional regulator [Anaerolineae bacterium]
MPKPTFFNLPEDKRQAILDLAIEEFAGHDYKNASISRIVERAGIAKGSFYQYFADKKELYLYLIELATQEKTHFFQAHEPPQEMGIFVYLRWLISVGLSFEFSNPRLAQIGYRAVYGDAPLPAETEAVMKEGMMGYFRQLVQQGREQQAIDPAIDPDVAAFMFNAVFTNLGDYLLQRLAIQPETLLVEKGGGFADPEAGLIFDQVLQILESGLGAKEPQ